MTWFKVDDGFSDHPKVEALLDGDVPESAIALWVMSGSWSAKHLTDGFVPSARVRRFGLRSVEKAAKDLVRVGLWREAEGGYQFCSWDEYQPTRARVTADREAIAERVRRHRKSGDIKPEVLKKCGLACHHCGVTLSDASMTIDHLVARKAGGSTSVENCVASCVSCNASKRDSADWVTGYTCQCVTRYKSVAPANGNAAPVPTRPDPSRPDQTNQNLPTVGSDAGAWGGESVDREPDAGDVQRWFKSAYQRRFRGVLPTMTGKSTHAFPEQLIGTARAKGVHPRELLESAFARWNPNQGDEKAKEIAQNYPYASFCGRFGSLAGSEVDQEAPSALEALQAQASAALKSRDIDAYNALNAQITAFAEGRKPRGDHV